MLHFIISIAGILLTILFVIGTHESAHFIAARLLGVRVLRFSIGFGKTLFRWHDKSGTEYVFALIPLGGYVKMLDENEGTVPNEELHLAYNRQAFYKKFLIVLAGPFTNILCAFLLYWMIFMIGFVTVTPMIGDVTPRSIAAEAGLTKHTEIVRIDNNKTMTWTSIMLHLLTHAGDQDHLKMDVQNPTTKQQSTHVLDLSNWHLNNLTPDPLVSLGIKPFAPEIPLIIKVVADNSPAASANLKIDDKIIAVNNKPIKDWEALITTITKHPSETMSFTIERNGNMINLPVSIGYKRDLLLQKTGYLGISPNFHLPKDMLRTIQYGPIEALAHAWQEITDFTYFNLLIFGKLFTGKLSMQTLGGPITIFQSAGEALNSGFLSFISFLAFLSISIGIINLLPIPGLDGGHLFIQIVEAIIRRPVPEQVMLILYRIGFALIIFVLIQALVNDVLRMY